MTYVMRGFVTVGQVFLFVDKDLARGPGALTRETIL